MVMHVPVICNDCWLVVGQRNGTEEGSGVMARECGQTLDQGQGQDLR